MKWLLLLFFFLRQKNSALYKFRTFDCLDPNLFFWGNWVTIDFRPTYVTDMTSAVLWVVNIVSALMLQILSKSCQACVGVCRLTFIGTSRRIYSLQRI